MSLQLICFTKFCVSRLSWGWHKWEKNSRIAYGYRVDICIKIDGRDHKYQYLLYPVFSTFNFVEAQNPLRKQIKFTLLTSNLCKRIIIYI